MGISTLTTIGKVHNFYNDSRRNRDGYPPWFFENCSRETAESVLTLGKQYGNVLIRESVTFKNTGSYVISMRREVSGGTQLNHYEVMKTPEGFKINVDNRHSPMRSLQDVVDFFVKQAGPGTNPMRTNDLRKIGLNMTSTGFRAGDGGGRPRHHHDNDSGFDDPFDPADGSFPNHNWNTNNRDGRRTASPGRQVSPRRRTSPRRHSPRRGATSPRRHSPRHTASPRRHSPRRHSPRRQYSPRRRSPQRRSPPPRQHHTLAAPRSYQQDERPRLNLTGTLPAEMASMARELEYDIGKQGRAGVPAAPPPPPAGVLPPPAPPPPGPPPPPGAPPLPQQGGGGGTTITSLRMASALHQYKRVSYENHPLPGHDARVSRGSQDSYGSSGSDGWSNATTTYCPSSPSSSVVSFGNVTAQARSSGYGTYGYGTYGDPDLSQAVPPRSVPTQTLQRANGQPLDGLNDGAEMYLNEDEMNGSPVHMSPPPLPAGHPTLARYSDHDLSPGSPGGFSPTRPDFRRGSEPAVSMTGFATTPLQRARPVLQKELSFEDELKNRLVSQREDIYASGATVLKSNWH